MDVSLVIWVAFVAFVVAMLAVDLVLFGREAREVTTRHAATWSVVWVALALVFWAGLWAAEGDTRANEFLAGYVVEKSLSVDNIFVFALLFSYFAVPPALQHRVLLWGVVMALVMRGAFIAVGAALLAAFHWMIYVFGAFLVITGIRLATHKDDEVHPERNVVLRLLRRVIAISGDYRGTRLFVREDGRRLGTPLLAVVVAVATTDLLFALDSIPAIFAITNVTFIVFTANAFALLGLRALFFLVVGLLRRFIYLKVGLSIILVFVGIKMLLTDVVGKVPVGISLGVIITTLAITIIASLRATRGMATAETEDERQRRLTEELPSGELLEELRSADR